jgi:hypothetical protein
MKQAKFNFAVFMASLCALLVLAASPVLAHSSNSGSGGDDDSVSSSGEVENETETEIHHQADLFRKDGEHKLQLQRAEKGHAKSLAQRARTCQNIQRAVNHKLKAFDNHADKYLTRLNDVFAKLQAYQTAQNISADNYDALVAAATQKQSDATVAVEALKSLGTTIDCTSSDPASMLASVKSGATDARDALKDYRKALKDIVVALAQANKNDDTATEDN